MSEQIDRVFEVLITMDEDSEEDMERLQIEISGLADSELDKCIKVSKKYPSYNFFHEALICERKIRRGK